VPNCCFDPKGEILTGAAEQIGVESWCILPIFEPVTLNPKRTYMEHRDLLTGIEQKITQLGDARRQLLAEVNRLREENESLYRINKELQGQIDALSDQNKVLTSRPEPVPVQEQFREHTRQRITDLVREIDECIALLNK
jgi:FtsZ-binding cell division protein ZapB